MNETVNSLYSIMSSTTELLKMTVYFLILSVTLIESAKKFINKLSAINLKDLVVSLTCTSVPLKVSAMLKAGSLVRKLKNKTKSASSILFSAMIPKAVPPVPVVVEQMPLWQLASASGQYVKLAGALGATAVALGAYGAHSKFPEDEKIDLKDVWDRANKYHFLHALAMLGVPLVRWPALSGTFFVLGVALFSGSCYYLALTGDRSYNKVTPIGGVCFIFGWLSMIL